jgi:hypothetical protein
MEPIDFAKLIEDSKQSRLNYRSALRKLAKAQRSKYGDSIHDSVRSVHMTMTAYLIRCAAKSFQKSKAAFFGMVSTFPASVKSVSKAPSYPAMRSRFSRPGGR